MISQRIKSINGTFHPPKGELLLEQIVVVPPNSKIPSIKGISMKIDKGRYLKELLA